MLIKDGNYLKLYPWKVRYVQHGEEHEQWALPNKEWWVEFAERWEHAEIIEFVEIELTEEQLARANEIEAMPMDEGYRTLCVDYIMRGTFPGGANHPLKDLQLQKESQRHGVEISEREINEIVQGLQISDLEIQLMELTRGV